MDLISVVVPVYNAEKYIRRCVNSIQNQTYHNLEIILVDDGSPDKSGQICDQLSKEDDRIRVVHKQNAGPGFARNVGIELMTGRYVTFIDSDDWIDASHIENLYNALVLAKADLCIGGHTIVYESNEKIVHPANLEQKVYRGDEIVTQVLLPLIGPEPDYPNDVQLEPSSSMSLYDAQIIKDHNIRFLNGKSVVSEDLYFNMDYLQQSSSVVITDEVGYFYFVNDQSISRKYNPEQLNRTVGFYSEVTRRIKQYGLEDKVAYRLDRSYLMRVRVLIRQIVMSDLRFGEKYRDMQNVLQHSLTRSILNSYPIECYIPAMRFLVRQMKRRHLLTVYWMIRFREMAHNTNWLKQLLHRFGIRR